jgi:hypothetical protein
MKVKLINLCEYTLNQSLYEEGVYEGFQTLAGRMDAQNFINNLKKRSDTNNEN